jgi:GTP-binding protein
MFNFLKYHNLRVTVIATKSDKIKNSERKKCKEVILNTLELEEDDKLIITSSEKKEGLGLVLSTLDSVIEKYPEYPIKMDFDDVEEV